MTTTLSLLATGPLALVQDLGRPGHRAVGVGACGAADRAALRRLNRLLGNHENAAAVEVLLGGLTLHADASVMLAVTGAPGEVLVDGRPVGHAAVLRLRAGQRFTLGNARQGLRRYVGVRGGVEVTAVLGSRSTDVLSGLGPAALQAGDRLAVGTACGSLPDVDQLPCDPTCPPGPVGLAVTPGPRVDWLPGGLGALAGRRWTVAPDSDRVGIRLLGPPLDRSQGELPSEGLLPGAVQLPPDGRPVLFLADAPVTGGYPVVAVLTGDALDLAAQLRPGDGVTLVAEPNRRHPGWTVDPPTSQVPSD